MRAIQEKKSYHKNLQKKMIGKIYRNYILKWLNCLLNWQEIGRIRYNL